MNTSRPGSSKGTSRSGSGGEESMTGRTESWEGRTLAASGKRPLRRPTIDEFRRSQADKAIAQIEERYRRRLSIPKVR
jgi:hypothetical protein